VARSLLRVQVHEVGKLYTFGYATVRTGDGLRQLLDDLVDLVVDVRINRFSGLLPFCKLTQVTVEAAGYVSEFTVWAACGRRVVEPRLPDDDAAHDLVAHVAPPLALVEGLLEATPLLLVEEGAQEDEGAHPLVVEASSLDPDAQCDVAIHRSRQWRSQISIMPRLMV
jgi:hypothetical protein